MTGADWPAVMAIHGEGIATGQATFASAPPATFAEFCAGTIAAGSLVAREAAGVAGWTRITRVSNRPVYAGVTEVGVYVSAAARGRGVGGA